MLRRRVGKQLPKGLLDEECEKTGKSRSELQLRVRFAERVSEDEVCNAVTQFGSWHAIVNTALANPRPEPVAKSVNAPVGTFATIVADPSLPLERRAASGRVLACPALTASNGRASPRSRP